MDAIKHDAKSTQQSAVARNLPLELSKATIASCVYSIPTTCVLPTKKPDFGQCFPPGFWFFPPDPWPQCKEPNDVSAMSRLDRFIETIRTLSTIRAIHTRTATNGQIHTAFRSTSLTILGLIGGPESCHICGRSANAPMNEPFHERGYPRIAFS